jgi:hypothetical protein
MTGARGPPALPESQNPFVGPRPFERDEWMQQHFFGREVERLEIVAYIYSQPCTLIYSPSGAGKTSLMNAGVIPLLEIENNFQVLPVARVKGRVDIESANKVSCFYMYQALTSMFPKLSKDRARQVRLAEFLKAHDRPVDDGETVPRVIVFDQFEEILSIYSEDSARHQIEFFKQVAEALKKDPLLRIVWLVRDDQLGQLETFERHLPDGLGLRYRLERLTEESALDAVSRPVKETDRWFGEGVAGQLVTELLKTRAEVRPGQYELIKGEFVEPVQLQVVCQSLWEQAGPGEISIDDLKKFGDVQDALKRYYTEVITSVVAKRQVDEKLLRRWFSTRLITPMRTRGTVFRGDTHTDDVIEIPNQVVEELEKQHIIRGDRRAAGQWYELVHDTFIEPVLEANSTWFGERSRRTPVLVRILLPIVLVSLVTAVAVFYMRNRAELAAGRNTAILLQKSDIISPPGEINEYRLQLRRDTAVSLSVDSVPIVSKLRLMDDQRRQILAGSDLDPGPNVLMLVRVPHDGQYTIAISAEHSSIASSDAGRYRITAVAGMELASTSTQTGELERLGQDTYLLQGTGRPVRLNAQSSDLDTRIEVYTADGTPVGENDDREGAGTPDSSDTDSELFFTAKTHEIYVVAVSSSGLYEEDGGGYELKALLIRVETLRLGSQHRGQLGLNDDPVLFKIPQDATQLSVRSPNGGRMEVSVYSEEFETLLTSDVVSEANQAGIRLKMERSPRRTALLLNVGVEDADFLIEAR